jgi:hypothetical protein
LPFFGGLMQESQRNDYFKLKKKSQFLGLKKKTSVTPGSNGFVASVLLFFIEFKM